MRNSLGLSEKRMLVYYAILLFVMFFPIGLTVYGFRENIKSMLVGMGNRIAVFQDYVVRSSFFSIRRRSGL